MYGCTLPSLAAALASLHPPVIIAQVAGHSREVFGWGGGVPFCGGIRILDFRGATITLTSELARQGDVEL